MTEDHDLLVRLDERVSQLEEHLANQTKAIYALMVAAGVALINLASGYVDFSQAKEGAAILWHFL